MGIVCGAGLGLVLAGTLPAAAQTTRVSVASNGAEANGPSQAPAISANGRFVAFESTATNIDSGTGLQVFVRDRENDRTVRLRLGIDGRPPNSGIRTPAISANGRYVAFASAATNLVPGDTNTGTDIFRYDTLFDETIRVSVADDGAEAYHPVDGSVEPAISDDGRFVAFVSSAVNLVRPDANNSPDVFVRDVVDGRTYMVSVASDGTKSNGASADAVISADGRHVAFSSRATNLVGVGNDTNGVADVFVHDRQTGSTTRVSVVSGGGQAVGGLGSSHPSISADGRYVAFASTATNLSVFDTNNREDIFVHDRQNVMTYRLSVNRSGSEGNGRSLLPSLSADGRFVAFASDSDTLVPGDTNNRRDIFVREVFTGQITRVSVATDNLQANGQSSDLVSRSPLSADGSVVAFVSGASNLVPGDNNNALDIFARVLREPRCQGPADCHELPGAPSNLTTLVSGSTVTLTWVAPVTGGAVLAYVLRAGTGPGLSDAADAEIRSTVTSLTVPGVRPGTFYVRVHARNAAGTGPASNEVTVTVGGQCAAAPNAPSGLTASVSGVVVSLSWSPPAQCPADSFVIEAGSFPGLDNLFRGDVGNVSLFTATAPPGVYFVRVRGRNAFGAGPASNEVTVALGGACAAPPAAPTGLTATVAGRRVSLSWSAAPGCPAQSYVLAAGSVTGAADVFLSDIGNVTSLTTTAPPGTYYVRVRGRNALGVSGASNEVTVIVQ